MKVRISPRAGMTTDINESLDVVDVKEGEKLVA